MRIHIGRNLLGPETNRKNVRTVVNLLVWTICILGNIVPK
jgi:hypothetical protein